MIFSDPTTEPLEALDRKGAVGAFDRCEGRRAREVHRPSRAHGVAHHRRLPADGADRMRGRHRAGVLGRVGSQHGDGVEDYFRQLTDFEPRRAAQYGIQHYAWLGMNPKESDDRELSRASAASASRVPRSPDGARHRRDRPEPRDAQRDRDLHGAGRAGGRTPAADPDPHAASRGQAQGHADLGRRAAALSAS